MNIASDDEESRKAYAQHPTSPADKVFGSFLQLSKLLCVLQVTRFAADNSKPFLFQFCRLMSGSLTDPTLLFPHMCCPLCSFLFTLDSRNSKAAKSQKDTSITPKALRGKVALRDAALGEAH
jgi:hypothetical protein